MAAIRTARPEDFTALYEINRLALGYDFPLYKTKTRLAEILAKPGNRIFLAEINGQPAGYIHGSDYDCSYSEPLKNILALAVLPAFQGQGVGKALLRRLEAWAAEDGAAGVRLVSGMNRESAHGFYKACGYSLRKTQKNLLRLF